MKLNLMAGALAAVIGLAPAGAAFADGGSQNVTQGGIKLTSGQLTLSNVPSNLQFADTEISAGRSATLDAKDDNVIEVHDFRGTGTGWSLDASLTQQFANANRTLDGATISLVDGKIQNPTSDDTTATVNPTISTDSSHILSADADQGMDVTTDTINQFRLDIPGKDRIYAGTYSATITWVLNDTPASAGSASVNG